jgi:protein TonB
MQISSAQLRSQFGGQPHPPATRRRPPYRPPAGLPLSRQERWAEPLSLVVHALLVFLLVTPLFSPNVREVLTQGAGGPGPAGGGGGGRQGAGGGQHVTQERLQYVEVQSAPTPTPAETPEQVTPPPEEQKVIAPKVDLTIEQPKSEIDLALTSGIGGGTGTDGSGGNGPGSGGGVGSGIGTGRGSSVGPGTGGGEGTIYPPTPDFTPLPPWPVPNSVKGHVVVLYFTVDERGRTVKLEFAPTKDAAYNRKIREAYSSAKFRPATKWDGTPVQATVPLTLMLGG